VPNSSNIRSTGPSKLDWMKPRPNPLARRRLLQVRWCMWELVIHGELCHAVRGELPMWPQRQQQTGNQLQCSRRSASGHSHRGAALHACGMSSSWRKVGGLMWELAIHGELCHGARGELPMQPQRQQQTWKKEEWHRPLARGSNTDICARWSSCVGRAQGVGALRGGKWEGSWEEQVGYTKEPLTP
jgi:hypothetical protein